MGGWVGGWMGGKAGLRIAYSNQKHFFIIKQFRLEENFGLIFESPSCFSHSRTGQIVWFSNGLLR
jgi:hypothetical protein